MDKEKHLLFLLGPLLHCAIDFEDHKVRKKEKERKKRKEKKRKEKKKKKKEKKRKEKKKKERD